MKLLPWAEKGLRWLCVLLPWAVLGYGLRFSLAGIPSTALEIVIFLLIGLFLFVHKGEGIRRAWKNLPSKWLLLAWVGIGLAAAIWSPSFIKGLGLWRAYFLEPVIVLAIVNVVLTRKEDRDALRTSFWSVTMFVCAWAMIQFITGKGIPHPWNVSIAAGRRATGPYGFPNAVALFVAPIAAYAGARFWILREKFAGVAALVGMIGILLVRSDGGMLAVLAAWFLAMLFVKRGRIVLAIGALLAIVVSLIHPSIPQMIWHGLTFQGWSGKVRLIMWGETWQMLKAHWFLGAGLGGYPVVFNLFHKARFIEIFQYPHQFVLTAWSEVGLPGLILFFGLLVSWGQRAWRSASTYALRTIAFAPLIAIVIHGLVDVPYWKNDLAVVFFLLWWLSAWVDQPGADTLR